MRSTLIYEEPQKLLQWLVDNRRCLADDGYSLVETGYRYKDAMITTIDSLGSKLKRYPFSLPCFELVGNIVLLINAQGGDRKIKVLVVDESERYIAGQKVVLAHPQDRQVSETDRHGKVEFLMRCYHGPSSPHGDYFCYLPDEHEEKIYRSDIVDHAGFPENLCGTMTLVYKHRTH